MSISPARLLASYSLVFILFAALDGWTAHSAMLHADAYVINPLARPDNPVFTVWRNLLAMLLLGACIAAGLFMGRDHITSLSVLSFRDYYPQVMRWKRGLIQTLFFLPLCMIWYRPISILNNALLALFNWSPMDPMRHMLALIPGVSDFGAQALLNGVLFVLCMKWLLLGCWWMLQASIRQNKTICSEGTTA